MAKQKRLFSGIQPTGHLHIGNYLGAIDNWLQLQERYHCIFSIVDLHALTVPQQPAQFKQRILEYAALYLALGLDPEKSILFIQSQIPAHTQLTWILNTISRISELKRMTQFKEKAQKQGEQVNLGLIDYPVLMAADILLYQTEVVPVGEDQAQHLELARTLARRFNRLYGPTFTIPQTILPKQTARIKGLDNPLKKMSKTAENPYNYIALTDQPELIRKKIRKAVTDSGKEIKYTPEKPAIANLIIIYQALTGLGTKEIEKRYQNKGYASFKEDLAEMLIEKLLPIQKKTKALLKKPDYLKKVFKEGAERARPIAQETLSRVKEKIGLIS